jgi:hypothetical protein
MKCTLKILRKVALAWALSVFVVLPTFAQSTLVATGSDWKYLNDGSEQGTAWRESNFDDSTWPLGRAELGFGEGDESTVIGSSVNGFITFYFRQAFAIADPSSLTNLVVILKRDDGAIVYLNHTEIFRSNMPPGPVDYLTHAATVAADDGKDWFTNAVNSGLLVSGANVLAVEVHQSTNNSSDISFDLALLGNVPPNPPGVSFLHPTNGAVLFTSNVTLNAMALDPDGAVTLVEFFVDGTKVAEDLAPPYNAVWPGVAPGPYTLTVVALDNQGLSATSAPVTVTVMTPASTLIELGAVWKYLDNGSDQGTGWREPAFDDSGWASGHAPLGYGDGDEATVLNGGPEADRIITTYFRRRFFIPDRSVYFNLVVRVLRDDGAVVYLNGAEIFRSNMSPGPVTHLTTAATAVEDDHYQATNVDLSFLVDGDNVLAVEIHQANQTSSDISFDLELRPNVPPTPPEVHLTEPTNMAFTAPASLTMRATASDLDSPVSHVEFFVDTRLIQRDSTGSDSLYSAVVNNLLVGTYALRAVAEDTGGLRGTSAPVQISVLGSPKITSLIATGSVWTYLDTGTNAGTSWIEPNFDDSGWKMGRGEFGYGDAAPPEDRPEATVLDFGRNANSKYVTYYFRHVFQASPVGSVTNLLFQVRRDDGAVVYLNGTEIFRMNMPASNPITFQTRATAAVGGADETTYFPMNIRPNLLREGQNLLAVEIHQATADSSDVSFDLQLDAMTPPGAVGPPLQIERSLDSNPTILLRWDAPDAVLQQTDQLENGWSDTPGNPHSPFSVQPFEAAKFYRLRF